MKAMTITDMQNAILSIVEVAERKANEGAKPAQAAKIRIIASQNRSLSLTRTFRGVAVILDVGYEEPALLLNSAPRIIKHLVIGLSKLAGLDLWVVEDDVADIGNNDEGLVCHISNPAIFCIEQDMMAKSSDAVAAYALKAVNDSFSRPLSQ